MGFNQRGQLGLGDLSDRLVPTVVDALVGARVYAPSASHFQTGAIRACPPSDARPCSGHGLCRQEGRCVCDRGFRGRDCSLG
jgi:hypothetical protein